MSARTRDVLAALFYAVAVTTLIVLIEWPLGLHPNYGTVFGALGAAYYYGVRHGRRRANA